MSKVTIHPSISKDLKNILQNLVKQKIEMNGLGGFPEFRNFSHVVEFMLHEGLKAYKKKMRDEDV